MFAHNLKRLARFEMYRLCVGVSDFVLTGENALQSVFLPNWTLWKGRSIKSNNSFNIDVINRSFVTQIPKVALDYEIDLSRLCPTGQFYSNLRFLETYSHSVQNTYIFYVWPKFTDCFFIHVWTLHCQNNFVHWVILYVA